MNPSFSSDVLVSTGTVLTGCSTDTVLTGCSAGSVGCSVVLFSILSALPDPYSASKSDALSGFFFIHSIASDDGIISFSII